MDKPLIWNSLPSENSSQTKDEIRTYSGTQVLNLLWSTCTAAVTSPTRVEGLRPGPGEAKAALAHWGVEHLPPALLQQGWADPAAVPQFPTMRHGASPLHTLMLKGPARPGEEASWEPQPPRQMGRKSVYRVTMPAQARASLLMASCLFLVGGRVGGAVTVPGLHSWLVTEASCSWLLSQKGSCVHSSCDSTRHLPEPTLGPRTKPWQSALPRESLPGPPSSATLHSVCGGWGVGEGRLWRSASLLSQGEWTGRPAVPPL